LVKVFSNLCKVQGFIRKQSLHKALLLFKKQRSFKGNFSFLRIKRKVPLTPLKEKNALTWGKIFIYWNKKAKAGL
jgi:hypothetical protein